MADVEEAPPENVLVQIIGHVNDLQTLFSLLTVSHQVYEVTARRLYRNPFFSAALATNKRRVYGRLLEYLVDYSDPQDDRLFEMLRSFRRQKVKMPQPHSNQPAISSPQHPLSRIDYLSYVESMDGLVDYVTSPKLAISMSWVEQATGLTWNAALMNAVTSSLAWTLGQHQQWRKLVDVVVPLYDLDRFMSILGNMVSIERIVFDMGQQGAPFQPHRSNNHHDNNVRLDRLQGALRVMDQWEVQRLAAGGVFLKTVTLVNLSSQERADVQMQALERTLYDRTMPCTERFREIRLDNWDQFQRLAKTEADFEAVQSIDLLSGTAVATSSPHSFVRPTLPPPEVLESILRRCRFLRSLSMACSRANTFQWAAVAVERLQTQQRSDAMATITHRMPLQHLRIECDVSESMPSILHDAMIAFGDTLCSVRFHTSTPLGPSELDIDDPHFRHGPEIRIGPSASGGGGWHLPRLRSLRISARGMIHVDPAAFSHCPQLEVLEMEDDTPKYVVPQASVITTTDTTAEATAGPWNLPRLERLVLRGYPAVLFAPASLCSMRACLVDLELQGAGWLGEERRFFIPPASERRRIKIEGWRWALGRPEQQEYHWQGLVRLRSMKLVGECALWFPLEALASGCCPQLTSLTLDIGGHRFPSLGIAMGREGKDKRARQDTTTSGNQAPQTILQQQEQEQQQQQQQQQQLTRLYLIGSWEVTDRSLENILDRLCPKLKLLVLQQARHYTNAGLVAAAERHPTLERVVTSRYLRIRDVKLAGLELLPWPSRGCGCTHGGNGGGNSCCNHGATMASQGLAPLTAADLAQITGQKDLRCIIYQMDSLCYRRTTRTW